MSEKYVVVEGFVGLGNRLRTAAAGLEYAKRTNRTLCINWSDGMFGPVGKDAFSLFFDIVDFPYCGIDDIDRNLRIYPKSFQYEMFKEPLRNNYTQKGIKNFYKRKILNYSLRTLDALKLNDLTHKLSYKYKYFQPKDGSDGRIIFGGELKENIEEEVVVFADNVPGYDPKLLRKHIRLKPYLNKKIDEFVAENDLEKNSLGLHIRATDKKFHGTLDKLIQKISSFTEKKDINRIFLCTDNKEIEDQLKVSFTDKIIVYPKLHPDDNIPLHLWAQRADSDQIKIQSAQEAILDMFILSRTEYILSQLGSTFSEISRVYHKDNKKEQYWQIFQYLGFDFLNLL